MGRYTRKQLLTMDSALRAHVKDILSLPERASSSFLYGHREDGAIGLTKVREEADFWAIDSAFKILTSPDISLRNAAMEDLAAEASHCARSQPAPNVSADYLNNRPFPADTV